MPGQRLEGCCRLQRALRRAAVSRRLGVSQRRVREMLSNPDTVSCLNQTHPRSLFSSLQHHISEVVSFCNIHHLPGIYMEQDKNYHVYRMPTSGTCFPATPTTHPSQAHRTKEIRPTGESRKLEEYSDQFTN